MRRYRPAPLLLTCLLALATGVALLGASVMVAVPAGEVAALPAGHSAAEANTTLVRAWYDAINATERSGQPADLERLLAVELVAHGGPPSLAPNRDGLVQRVLVLRATFPTMRLGVEDLRTHGDWVLARVRAEGLAQGVFLGVPLSGMPATWSGLDLFQIASGRIVEYWAAGDWPVLAQPLVQAPLAEPPAGAFVGLTRLTFAPGARLPSLGALGPLLLAVEAGTLTARVEGEAVVTHGAAAGTGGPPPKPVPAGADIVLGPGDGLLISPGVRHTLRNAEPTPAVGLSLALLPWSASAPQGVAGRWPEAESPDVAAHLLVEGVSAVLPSGPAVVALGRLTLAAGADLAPDSANWPRLAVVEAGTLGLATADGPATLRAAGQGAIVPAGTGTTLRNAGEGPLVVLLVTIAPASP
jgi:quercetin dioxygenase-like cupin family protein